MKNQKTSCLIAFALLLPAGARGEEKLLLVSTLPTLEALASEVGGEAVETLSLAKGDQDPHFVSPTPVLMQKTRRADLFIQVGMSPSRHWPPRSFAAKLWERNSLTLGSRA